MVRVFGPRAMTAHLAYVEPLVVCAISWRCQLFRVVHLELPKGLLRKWEAKTYSPFLSTDFDRASLTLGSEERAQVLIVLRRQIEAVSLAALDCSRIA